MAKESGLYHGLAVGGFDLSNDIGSVGSIACPKGTLETTGIDKGAFERIYGLKDGVIELAAFFNPDEDRAHEVLSALPTTDTAVTYFAGFPLGRPAASMVAKQLTYDGSRGDDGAFTFAVPMNANGYGLEWGINLTGSATTPYFTSSGTQALTGVHDVSDATNFGLQAYVHLLAFTGTSVTVTIQDSDDNAVGDPYATVGTGAATSAMTAPGWQRIQTPRDANVKEWIRVNLTGTYTNAVLAVVVVRNEETVNF